MTILIVSTRRFHRNIVHRTNREELLRLRSRDRKIDASVVCRIWDFIWTIGTAVNVGKFVNRSEFRSALGMNSIKIFIEALSTHSNSVKISLKTIKIF